MDKQKLTITFEHEEGSESVSFLSNEGIKNDEMFWMWFMACWDCLGLNFIKRGIEENDG